MDLKYDFNSRECKLSDVEKTISDLVEKYGGKDYFFDNKVVDDYLFVSKIFIFDKGELRYDFQNMFSNSTNYDGFHGVLYLSGFDKDSNVYKNLIVDSENLSGFIIKNQIIKNSFF